MVLKSNISLLAVAVTNVCEIHKRGSNRASFLVSGFDTHSPMSLEIFTNSYKFSRSTVPGLKLSFLAARDVVPKIIRIGAILFALGLSLAWLLPNHYMPWKAFHSDAWAAFVWGVAALGIIFLSRADITWPRISLLIACLVGVPLLQFIFGIIPFAGQAWVSASYLLALLIAILCGFRLEDARTGLLPDALFAAIGIASVLSVGLQLYQWLHLDGLGILSMGFVGGRPYANLGQPNQLGTLLLLGILASAWGYEKKKIGATGAILMAIFVLFGIVLTQSRTAWIGIIIILGAIWVWRGQWSSKRLPRIALVLGIYFFLANLAVPWMVETFNIPVLEKRELGIKENDLRLLAWRLFIDAVLQNPWFGYGLTGLGHAQLSVALEHPALSSTFHHSHNLFMDLVLWLGIPLGALVVIFVLRWIFRKLRKVSAAEDKLLLIFVMILGNHAMLELPLHYVYFLLPLGFVIGVLEKRLPDSQLFFTTPRWTLFTFWIAAAFLFLFLVQDYLRVEENYYALRFERARIGTLPPQDPPEVVLLTQLREELRLARYKPVSDVDDAEIEWLRKAAYISPGTSEIYRLATTLALNERPLEAGIELQKLCKIVPKHQCDLVKRVWEEASHDDPAIAAVKWGP